MFFITKFIILYKYQIFNYKFEIFFIFKGSLEVLTSDYIESGR